MRAPPHPRPSAAEFTLAPRSWRALGHSVPLLQPRESSPFWCKSALRLGDSDPPPSEPQLSWRALWERARSLLPEVASEGRTWDGALCECHFPDPIWKPQSPSPSLPPSLGLQSLSQSQSKWEAEVASRGDGRGRKYVAWEGEQGGPGAVYEDTHLTYWREWRGVTQLPPRGRKRVGSALARLYSQYPSGLSLLNSGL